jgi:hypothetical protein
VEVITSLSSLKINLPEPEVYTSKINLPEPEVSSNNIGNIRNNLSQVVAQVQVLAEELLVSQEVVQVVIKVVHLGFECHQIVIMVMNTIMGTKAATIILLTAKWPLIRAGGPRCQLLTKPVVVILMAIQRPPGRPR